MMLTKIGIVGLMGATAIGMGTGAVASSTSSSKPSSPTSATAHPRIAGLKHLLRNAEHGQLVTKGKGGSSVTHDLIHGTVTAVSPSAITVVAADKVSQTYVITADTKVRMRATRARASISAVHKGDDVFVLGTGTSTFTAKRVIDLG